MDEIFRILMNIYTILHGIFSRRIRIWLLDRTEVIRYNRPYSAVCHTLREEDMTMEPKKIEHDGHSPIEIIIRQEEPPNRRLRKRPYRRLTKEGIMEPVDPSTLEPEPPTEE